MIRAFLVRQASGIMPPEAVPCRMTESGHFNVVFCGGVVSMFTFENFPLVIVIALILMAWFSFFSVIL